MARKYRAQCACGAIKFEFDTDLTFIANWRCNDCKRAFGGEMVTFFAAPDDDLTLFSSKPKAFHYIANSGNGLNRNFCPECGSRAFTSNLDSFPKTVFVQLGSPDRPDLVAPKLERFAKRRMPWNKPLNLPQFEATPR
jgi:hypothetical protein